jgi:hypothetical protein
MSAVGIVSIAVGVVAVCGRGFLLVAPVAALRWFTELTSARIRVVGACGLAVGATVAWAGASEDSVLAMILSVGGWAVVVLSTSALLLFPGVYHAIVKTIVPSEPSGNLTLWRVRGLGGVVAGLILIYYGVLAL